MSTRTFAIVAATCLAVSARLLAASALLDSSAIGLIGLVPLLVLGIARWQWQNGYKAPERPRREHATAAMFWGAAFCAIAGAGFVNGRYGPGALLLVAGATLVGWGWWARRRSG